jgi:TPR repeat protein
MSEMEEKKYTLEEAIACYEENRFEEALTALKQHRKNAEAQYYLGMIHYEGFGVEKDIEAAKRWFKKASRQGSLDAEYMLLCCEGNTTSCCKA